MSERFAVHFETTGREADGRVVREYIRPAIERLEERTLIDRFHFFRYGHTDDQPSEVRLRLRGDRDEVWKTERENWDQLQDAGVIREWRVTDWPSEGLFDGAEEELANRLFETASLMTFQYFEEFDESEVDPVNTVPQKGNGGPGVGMWVLLHALFNHQAYAIDEEIAACRANIQNRLYLIGRTEGVDEMEARVEALTDDIEGFADRTKRLLEDERVDDYEGNGPQ